MLMLTTKVKYVVFYFIPPPPPPPPLPTLSLQGSTAKYGTRSKAARASMEAPMPYELEDVTKVQPPLYRIALCCTALHDTNLETAL